MTISKLIFLLLYYGFSRYLPSSTSLFFGKSSRKIRYVCVKKIFKKCGKNVNINRLAFFGSGVNIEIGDNSGLGVNCLVPSNVNIGANVMIAPNCIILNTKHNFDRVDIPMIDQGTSEAKPTVIEDDVWIGQNVILTPGRHVKKGTIIASGCVLSKDFPEYSIVGGNPSHLIRSRIKE